LSPENSSSVELIDRSISVRVIFFGFIRHRLVQGPGYEYERCHMIRCDAVHYSGVIPCFVKRPNDGFYGVLEETRDYSPICV
jgi:hypothetical protein